MIDQHSLTWKAVLAFAENERQDAIANLISDRDSERQRGALALLERLTGLTDGDDAPIYGDHYT